MGNKVEVELALHELGHRHSFLPRLNKISPHDDVLDFEAKPKV
jgi:hypothetical protein